MDDSLTTTMYWRILQGPSYYPYIISCIAHSLHLAIIRILWIEVPIRRGKMYRISYVHKLYSIHFWLLMPFNIP